MGIHMIEGNLTKLILEFERDCHPRSFKYLMTQEKKAGEGRMLRYNSDGSVNLKWYDENLVERDVDIQKLKENFSWVKNL